MSADRPEHPNHEPSERTPHPTTPRAAGAPLDPSGPSAEPAREETIDVLNDLIENCKDGEYGFQTCAEHCKSPELKSTFTRRAAECRTTANELQGLVATLGGKPETSGTVTGAVHRGWVAARGAVALDDDLSMLEECERGEDAAVARYRSALKKPLPAAVAEVVRRQAAGAQQNHDDIKRLRDEYRQRSAR